MWETLSFQSKYRCVRCWSLTPKRWALSVLSGTPNTQKKEEAKSITDFSWLQSFPFEIQWQFVWTLHGFIELSFVLRVCCVHFLFPFSSSKNIFRAFSRSLKEEKNKWITRNSNDEKKNKHQTDFRKKFIDTQHVTRKLWVSSSHP